MTMSTSASPVTGGTSSSPEDTMLQLIVGYWNTQALRTAARLGIADLIGRDLRVVGHGKSYRPPLKSDAPPVGRTLACSRVTTGDSPRTMNALPHPEASHAYHARAHRRRRGAAHFACLCRVQAVPAPIIADVKKEGDTFHYGEAQKGTAIMRAQKN